MVAPSIHTHAHKPDWVIATAGIIIGLFIAVGLGYLLGSNASSIRPARYPSYKIAESHKVGISKLASDSTSSTTREPCVALSSETESELCAQWKAADAAKSSTVATWIFGALSALIGGSTLAAAIMAARYARDAARETKRGADAAHKSYIAMIRSEDAELIVDYPIVQFHDGDKPHYIVVAAISNIGRASATLTKLQFNDTVHIVSNVIRPGETITAPAIGPIPATSDPLYLHGIVNYKTVLHQNITAFNSMILTKDGKTSNDQRILLQTQHDEFIQNNGRD